VNVSDVRKDLWVAGIRRRGGTCTGRVDATRCVPEGAPRAEVAWDDGGTRWPLVSILVPLGETP